ncbi:ATP-binding protein, partial [Janibacter sp. RAF20_2_2]
VRAEDATAVGLILSELVQNAVEHGIPEGGSIHVDAQRTTEDDEGDILRVTVVDDGRGLPTGFRPSRAGLGTRIVTSMVHDLGGQIRWDDAEPHGTRVRFSVRLGGVES